MSWCYSGLVRHLPPGIPVYGLQAAGLDGDGPLPATLQEMAAEYADLVRQTQPEGPYRLLGWSLGGNVAFAMARELRARGQEVELLAFLDAYPRRAGAGPEAPLAEVFAHNLRDAGFDVAEEELTGGRFPTARYRAFLNAAGDPMGRLDEAELAAVLEVFMNNAALMRGHTPGTYDGDVLVLAAERADGDKLARRGAESCARTCGAGSNGSVSTPTTSASCSPTPPSPSSAARWPAAWTRRRATRLPQQFPRPKESPP